MITTCTKCGTPAHATESNDDGVCAKCLGSAPVNPNSYGNVKVDALLAGTISIASGTFTSRDFVDLALAALDQSGVSATLQRRVNELVADEIEDGELHVQPCTVDNGAPCYGCEFSAAAKHWQERL